MRKHKIKHLPKWKGSGKKNQNVTWGDSLQNKPYAKHFQKNKTEILKDTLNSLFRKRKKYFGAEN